MKEQWKQGLQWGAAVWLAWLAASSIAGCVHWGFTVDGALPAIGWTMALALAWTRWPRLGIAIGLTAQVYAALGFGMPILQRMEIQIDGVTSASYLDLEPLLTSFVPACLPVLPLLFMAPERPRHTAALALVGRWRDAERDLAGIRWILVAASVLALHSAFPDAFQLWTIDEHGAVCFRAWHVAKSLAPCAILLAIALLPAPRDRAARAAAVA